MLIFARLTTSFSVFKVSKLNIYIFFIYYYYRSTVAKYHYFQGRNQNIFTRRGTFLALDFDSMIFFFTLLLNNIIIFSFCSLTLPYILHTLHALIAPSAYTSAVNLYFEFRALGCGK